MATTRVSSPEVVFDPKLHRFRNLVTGRIVPTLLDPWVCLKSPAGAHYWLISANRGQCKYCGKGRSFPYRGAKSKGRHANIR